MRSKAPLALIEQLIMLLVFALAAALCLQVFALSGKISRQIETRDRAVTAVQNTAEALKACRGDLDALSDMAGGALIQSGWQLCYDEIWQPTSTDQAAYLITVSLTDSAAPLLGTATVSAETPDGEVLFQVTVAWQEGAYE